MKQLVVFAAIVLLISACGGKKNELSYDQRIAQYEDSIEQWGGGLGSQEEINGFAERYINLLLETYNEESSNPNNATYLDRVHMWYASIGKPNESVKWGETLLKKFPNYSNRAMVIESMAAMYDGDITPRDSNKVRSYYTQLLTEFPKLNPEKRKDIEKRLKYNNLSLEEYIVTVSVSE